MYKEVNPLFEVEEQEFSLHPDVADNIISLIRVLAEMSVTDDLVRMDFLVDYSNVLLRCIQSDCISRLICEKE